MREYDEQDGSLVRDETVVTDTRIEGDTTIERCRYYCDGELVGCTETTTSPGHVTIRRWDYESLKFTLITRDEFAMQACAPEAAQAADAAAHEDEWDEVIDCGDVGEIG